MEWILMSLGLSLSFNGPQEGSVGRGFGRRRRHGCRCRVCALRVEAKAPVGFSLGVNMKTD